MGAIRIHGKGAAPRWLATSAVLVSLLTGAIPWALARPGAGSGLPAPISQAMRDAGLQPADIGLVVLPLSGAGAPLLSLNPDVAMNPASTMKLLTTYLALSVLGPSYRWRTGAYLRGRLDNGVLDGDLVLRGGGDPKLVVEDLAAFVARMRAAGLREIRGDLVIDDAIYDPGDRRSVEQFDGDTSQPYNVRPSPLLLNFKAVRVVVQPQPSQSAVSVRLDPPLADVDIDAEISLAAGACRWRAGDLLIRDAGTESRPMIRIRGPYSTGCGEQGIFTSVLSHRQFAQALFKSVWTQAGGVWGGVARYEPGAATGPSWLEWESPRTLVDVVSDVNKFSNNVMSRQLLLQVAAESTRKVATAVSAREFAVAWLAGQGMTIPELVIDNGSGLSREERISPVSLARLLLHVARHPTLADLFRDSLPRVGLDGTMRHRLTREPVAGQAWIKTGTLANVKTIAGYVDAASGRRYALVMFVNGNRADFSRPVQDAVLRWVHAEG